MIGYVYKIISNETDKCYVGSTIKNINQRFTGHKRDYKRHNNGNYHYTSSYDILQYDDAKIECIVEIEFEDKKELIDLESKYIKELDCVNIIIPDRTRKEYYEDNKHKIRQYRKKHYEDNIDKIKEYRSKKILCECGKFISCSNISIHKKSKKHLNYIKNL